MEPSSKPPQINPSVLVIVIILSIVFICSGLLHILARCLGRQRRAQDHSAAISPTRGHLLQQLFSLPDAGVEQAIIDTLPVFLYGSIRGLKDSADCAVCLSEFRDEDKLRLLPLCKHAFHVRCIDAWLHANSTCPLCRRSLLQEAEPATTAPPSPESTAPGNPNPQTAPTVCVTDQADGAEKTVRVELGKVHSFDSRRGSGAPLIPRFARSFSMGEYEYVVKPTHRSARSEDAFWANKDLSRVCSPLQVQLGHHEAADEEHHAVEIVSIAPSIPSRLLKQAPADGGESSRASPSLKKSASLSWLRCDSGASPVKKLAPSISLRRLDPSSPSSHQEIDHAADEDHHHVVEVSEVDFAPSRRLDPDVVIQPEKVSINVVVDGESSGLLGSLKKSASLDWLRCESGLSPSLKKSASLSWLRGRSNKVFCTATPSTEIV